MIEIFRMWSVDRALKDMKDTGMITEFAERAAEFDSVREVNIEKLSMELEALRSISEPSEPIRIAIKKVEAKRREVDKFKRMKSVSIWTYAQVGNSQVHLLLPVDYVEGAYQHLLGEFLDHHKRAMTGFGSVNTHDYKRLVGMSVETNGAYPKEVFREELRDLPCIFSEANIIHGVAWIDMARDYKDGLTRRTRRATGPRSKSYVQDAILEGVKAGPVSIEYIRGATGATRGCVQQTFVRLKKLGKIETVDRGIYGQPGGYPTVDPATPELVQEAYPTEPDNCDHRPSQEDRMADMLDYLLRQDRHQGITLNQALTETEAEQTDIRAAKKIGVIRRQGNGNIYPTGSSERWLNSYRQDHPPEATA